MVAERDEDGAVVNLYDRVRCANQNPGRQRQCGINPRTLNPGMIEKALAEIVDEARNRWPLGRVTVIHRIGELWPAMKSFCRCHQCASQQCV